MSNNLSNILNILNLEKPQDYSSQEAYKKDVLKAVQLLQELGINDENSSNLKTAIASVVQKIERQRESKLASVVQKITERQKNLEGRRKSKVEILQELIISNSELKELELEIAETKRKITILECASLLIDLS